MNCPSCQSTSSVLFRKDNYDYYQCSYCWTVFIPGGLDQSNKIGGEHEVGRNEKENSLRIDRIASLVGKYGRILDFGCGHGLLVKDLQKVGMDAVGYDAFNRDFDKMPDGQFNLVSLIEVIEHTTYPFDELSVIYDKLLPNGIVKIETSFVDVSWEEKIPLNEFFYFSVINGHCTVFSHFGLDVLMKSRGFKVVPPINRNVRIYQKKAK